VEAEEVFEGLMKDSAWLKEDGDQRVLFSYQANWTILSLDLDGACRAKAR
jgi:hypothetical protein